MNRLKKWKDLYDHLEEVIMIVLLAAMVVILFYQIIMRYLFNDSPAWTEEIARYMFIWETWVGISVGAKYGKHIEVTMLVDRLPERGRAALRIIADLIVIAICLVVVRQGTVLVDRLLSVGSYSPALHIPMGYIYAAVPVGCGLMILRNLGSIFRAGGVLLGKKQTLLKGGEE